MIKKLFIYALTFILCITVLISCSEKKTTTYSFEFPPIDFNTNRIYQKDFTFINGESFIRHGKLYNSGIIDYIAENCPDIVSQVDLTVYSTITDGEYLYCYTKYFGPTHSGDIERKMIIYKIDVVHLTASILAEWIPPTSGRGNCNMSFHSNYLYFFKSNDFGSNDICRIDVNGGMVETLTNNNSDLYTCLYFDEDVAYYQKGSVFYQSTLDNYTTGIILKEGIAANELYNGFLYYTKANDSSLYRFPLTDNSTEEVVLTDLFGTCWFLRDNEIYYCTNNNVVLSTDDEQYPIINRTGGKIYKYNISSQEHSLVYENDTLDIRCIMNINKDVIFVQAYTNDHLLGKTMSNGYEECYFLPLNGSYPILITDNTLT